MVISFDTNLLIYARLEGAPQHAAARAFLESLNPRQDVAIAELVLIEYYLALRNPALLSPACGAAAAVEECQLFRTHPRWALVENAEVMEAVWNRASAAGFARRRIIDVRIARTLIAHGVTHFATANVKDFQDLGFERVWNPLIDGEL